MRHEAEQFDLPLPLVEQLAFGFYQWPSCPLGAFAWWAVLRVHSRDTRSGKRFEAAFRARLPSLVAKGMSDFSRAI